MSYPVPSLKYLTLPQRCSRRILKHQQNELYKRFPREFWFGRTSRLWNKGNFLSINLWVCIQSFFFSLTGCYYKVSSSSSLCRAASWDIPNPLSLLLPIVHRLWQVLRATSRILTVGYHLPFQHNELFHQPYMTVAEISLGISLRVRPEEPFLLLKYIITLSLILCPYY